MVKLPNPKPTHGPECYPVYKDNIDSGRWEVPMLRFIEDILLCFRPCFSRKATFSWFVTVIAGFMIRSDMLGITSVIRDLSLNPALYNSMEHFFRADSWEWEDIFTTWARTISSHAPLKRIAGRAVLVGDGVKRASDGRYIPCTKKMVQESESASKASFIHGHLQDAVGILGGNDAKIFCFPCGTDAP